MPYTTSFVISINSDTILDAALHDGHDDLTEKEAETILEKLSLPKNKKYIGSSYYEALIELYEYIIEKIDLLGGWEIAGKE